MEEPVEIEQSVPVEKCRDYDGDVGRDHRSPLKLLFVLKVAPPDIWNVGGDERGANSVGTTFWVKNKFSVKSF